MHISIKERYEFLSKYVKDRRSQEEKMRSAKDPLVLVTYFIRRPATTFIGLWKDAVTKNRLRFRSALGIEKSEGISLRESR